LLAFAASLNCLASAARQLRNRIPVEVEKSERERGYYIRPELYGAPEEKSIAWARHPELMKRMKGSQVPSHPANKPVAQAKDLQAAK
jgi:hypothetical protein